jgi:hypothetical protein
MEKILQPWRQVSVRVLPSSTNTGSFGLPLSATIAGLIARFRKSMALVFISCFDARFHAFCGKWPVVVTSDDVRASDVLSRLCHSVPVPDCGSYVTGLYLSQASPTMEFGVMIAIVTILIANFHGLGRFVSAQNARKITAWVSLASLIAH